MPRKRIAYSATRNGEISLAKTARPHALEGDVGPSRWTAALALLAGPHELPHLARRERQLVAAHAVLRERVLDRARERARSAHPSALAAALDAVLGERRRRLHVPHADRGRHLGERRDQVVGERPGHELPVLVVVELLVERG